MGVAATQHFSGHFRLLFGSSELPAQDLWRLAQDKIKPWTGPPAASESLHPEDAEPRLGDRSVEGGRECKRQDATRLGG